MDSDNRKENMENNTRSLEDQSFMNMILEESAWLFSAPLTQQTQCDLCADVDTTSCPSYQDPLPYAMEQSQNLTQMDGCVPDTSAHGRSATMNADAETVCVKNELKQRIQRRRQASGLDELQAEMTDPRPEQVMTNHKAGFSKWPTQIIGCVHWSRWPSSLIKCLGRKYSPGFHGTNAWYA